MTAYDFTFPDGTNGRTAVAIDPLGNPVAVAAINLVNDECKASFDLPTGTYRAKIEGIDADDSMIVRDDASLDVADTTVTTYEFECNDGATITGSGGASTIPFDAVPEGFEAGTQFDLPDGLYSVKAFVMFAEPAEPRWIQFGVAAGSQGAGITVGPIVLDPDANSEARKLRFTAPLYRSGTGTVNVGIGQYPPDGTVDPADLELTYADFVFTKIP